MTDFADRPWIVCQIGAREHYVLARGLHRRGLLRSLITDAWASGGLASRLPGPLGHRLAGRYAPELADARVDHFTDRSMLFETAQRLRRRANDRTGSVMARNAWFERHAVTRMERDGLLADKPIVFAYSYAALGILRAAKAAGCVAVLGQIDPAIAEEDIVAAAIARRAPLVPAWHRAPAPYWTRWREECAVADRIVVNSAWARDGLLSVGIDAAKLRIVPLAYDGAAQGHPPAHPARFTPARPLRVLFLGSLIVRKGIAELIEAAALLRDEPVVFDLVGAPEADFSAMPGFPRAIVMHGAVPRAEAARHYAAADVFILPSLSDGFGLTQIEAQAHGLPVIASRRCGDVVHDGENGFLLGEVTGPEIAATIRRYLAAPALLDAQSAAAAETTRRFRPDRVVDQLTAAVSG